MEDIREFLNYKLLDNTIEKYAWFIGIIILGIIFKRLISKLSSKLLYRLFKRYSSEISSENFFNMLHKPFNSLILLIFFYIAANQLKFPERWELVSKHEFGLKMFLDKGFQVIFFSVVIWIMVRIVDVIGEILKQRTLRDDNKSNPQIVPFLIDAIKVVVVILGIFIILGTVLSINVGSLVAGLGIGGLAIALAAKETIENLLGSFTIFLDKPFAQGDLVKLNDISGVVEKIGFRSTRIRTLERTFVTIPNKKMVDAELDNLSLRTSQRAKFSIDLTYSTPAETIKHITQDIQHFLEGHSLINDDYIVKLNDLGSSSIAVLIIYFVDSTDYNVFIEVKEQVNYKIIEIVHQHKAEFAYPTSSVILQKEI
jgi:MscS family membrane protein